jgi:hypothetical protein
MVKNGNKLSSKMRSTSKKVQSMLSCLGKSKVVYYMTLLLSLVTVVGFIYDRDYSSIGLFSLVAVALYYYTKNKVIILATAVLFSNLLKVSISLKEGFDKGEEDKEDEQETGSSGAMRTREGNKNAEEECVGEKCKQGMSTISPQSLNDEDDVDNSFVDRSKTIENAYSSLDSIVGKDGVSKLSKDTENLLKKQNQLMDTVQNLGPIMDNMNKLVSGMGNMSNKDGPLSGIMQSMKNIGDK